MEDAGLFSGHLVNFPTMSYILWHFGIFCCHLEYFRRFGTLYNKNMATLGDRLAWLYCYVTTQRKSRKCKRPHRSVPPTFVRLRNRWLQKKKKRKLRKYLEINSPTPKNSRKQGTITYMFVKHNWR
jgi:hypothetical protein